MKIRFVTESGTVYTLDVEHDSEHWLAKFDGVKLPFGSGRLVREGAKPLVSAVHGGPLAEPAGERVVWERGPAVGESFIYMHPTLAGCISTPIVSIEEIKDDDYYEAREEGERMWMPD